MGVISETFTVKVIASPYGLPSSVYSWAVICDLAVGVGRGGELHRLAVAALDRDRLLGDVAVIDLEAGRACRLQPQHQVVDALDQLVLHGDRDRRAAAGEGDVRLLDQLHLVGEALQIRPHAVAVLLASTACRARTWTSPG